MTVRSRWSLWPRWVLANALGELIGLGSTFAIGIGLFSGLAEAQGILPAILSALLMASTGIIEGVIVGLAQWWAMHGAFTQLPRHRWVLATVIGALVAWFLGSVPMAVGSLSASTQANTAQEPPAALGMAIASGMGLIAGLVLGWPQWRALRRFRDRAWLWLPANGVGWAIGMPLVFTAVDLAGESGSLAARIAIMVGFLTLTGAVVGAIHGLALLHLARYSGGSARS